MAAGSVVRAELMRDGAGTCPVRPQVTNAVLVYSAILLSYVFGVVILVRAAQAARLSRYAFFHSYLVYFLATGLIALATWAWLPRYYPAYFWIKFFTLVIAEFALLVQIGDHIFAPYPALRMLGRTVTVGISVMFVIVYILPPLMERRPSDVAVLDLVKRSALTKGLVLFGLALLAGHFHIRLGRNISAIALGLVSYLGINTANFALAESLGRNSYGEVFSTIGPLSQTLMLLIWMIGLWNYEPAPVAPQVSSESDEERQETLPDRLGRYNNTLNRVIRK